MNFFSSSSGSRIFFFLHFFFVLINQSRFDENENHLIERPKKLYEKGRLCSLSLDRKKIDFENRLKNRHNTTCHLHLFRRHQKPPVCFARHRFGSIEAEMSALSQCIQSARASYASSSSSSSSLKNKKRSAMSIKKNKSPPPKINNHHHESRRRIQSKDFGHDESGGRHLRERRRRENDEFGEFRHVHGPIGLFGRLSRR